MNIDHLIRPAVSLKEYTTLHVGGLAEYFAEIHTRDELVHVTHWAKDRGLPIQILGGGSNVLVPDNGVRGLVVRPCFSEIVYEDEGDTTRVTVGSGVVLDDFIRTVVEAGWWGLENLSAIPGTVGGVPIQNVGAYGVEAESVIEYVTVFDLEAYTVHILDRHACAFGYRTSIFKTPEGRRYVVLSVTFRLRRNGAPHIAYRDLAEYFKGLTPTLQDIRDAVIHIRGGKFPDWHALGTAGSFFKNPSITHSAFQTLCARYPELPGFVQDNGLVKISLGWVLDKILNVRGYRQGRVGLYEKQALVVVNYGGASADEIISLSEHIITLVRTHTGIDIEREVVLFEK